MALIICLVLLPFALTLLAVGAGKWFENRRTETEQAVVEWKQAREDLLKIGITPDSTMAAFLKGLQARGNQ